MLSVYVLTKKETVDRTEVVINKLDKQKKKLKIRQTYRKTDRQENNETVCIDDITNIFFIFTKTALLQNL